MSTQKGLSLALSLAIAVFCAGCATTNSGNNGQVQSYAYPAIEPAWIRDGKPIEYDRHKWYPASDYEVMDDTEVLQVAQYKGVQVFVEKIATKPYTRLYTKFDKNKFRYYERHQDD